MRFDELSLISLIQLTGKKDIDDMYDLLAPYEECPGEETKLSAGWRCTITLFILHSSVSYMLYPNYSNYSILSIIFLNYIFLCNTDKMICLGPRNLRLT